MFEPPRKIDKRIYKCDKHFYLDPILEMYNNQINYGIALVSGKNYRFYLVEIVGSHKEFKLLMSDDLMVQKRQGRGGSSSGRISRIRDENEHHNIVKMSEKLIKTYMTNNNTKYLIDKLVIAGPSETKKKIIAEDITKQYFEKKIARVISTTEITDKTVYDVYYKCLDLFNTHDAKVGNEIINEAFTMMAQTESANYLAIGYKETIEALKNKTLEKLVIDKNLDEKQKTIIHELMYDKCQYVELDKTSFKGLGQIIGIKFYADTTNLDDLLPF